MIVYRFMSKKEYNKLLKGETLTNDKVHTGNTISIGFCFMNMEDDEPEFAFQYLAGVVDEDICVVFETNKKLTKSWGTYANPYGSFLLL